MWNIISTQWLMLHLIKRSYLHDSTIFKIMELIELRKEMWRRSTGNTQTNNINYCNFFNLPKNKTKKSSRYPFTRPISVDDFETTKEELSLYEIGLPSDNWRHFELSASCTTKNLHLPRQVFCLSTQLKLIYTETLECLATRFQ